MSQISVLKRITTKEQQNCEKFNQIILKKDLNQIFIGRDIDCNYRISSIEISRKHALLEYSIDNFWSISDLNSTNGLFINLSQLEANTPYRLVDGDRVSFGPPNQSQFCYQFRDNITDNSSTNCVSYELSAINLTTIPVIPIVTRIQTTSSSANSPIISSSLRFDIEADHRPNHSRTISLTTTMPSTRSGFSYSGSSSRGPRMSVSTGGGHSGGGGPSSKKMVSRKTSVDNRETQSLTGFVEHDYSRNSSSNRSSTDKSGKNKRLSSLKLKDNSELSSKSKASKVSELERKLIAKEKEKLEKSKKSLEQQKTMDRLKIKRKEEALKKKQLELERKEREANKKAEEIEKIRKDLVKEKKRLADKMNKESDESSLRSQSAKRKLRSSSTRESLDSKRQCTDTDSKQKEIEEIFDSDLTCSICSEYFIQAVNLNCSHTFCQSCIEEWKHSKPGSHVCPICREKITNQNRELILDNLIDNFVVKMKPHLKDHRKQVEEERKKRLEKKTAQSQQTARISATNRGRLSRLIPSLHFFLRQSNGNSESDSEENVNVIGLNFGDNYSISSSSSVSSVSDSDSSDDSSDDSSSDDESVNDQQSVTSRRSSRASSVVSIGSAIVSDQSDNDSDSSDSDSSLVSLHSNDSNPIDISISDFDGSDESDDSDYFID